MIDIKTKIINRTLQKQNKEAIKIQKEASNIYSLEAFSDCKESNLRKASRIKKLAIIRFVLLNTDGKKSRNKKEKKIVKVLSLVSTFRFAIKLDTNKEANKRQNNPIFVSIEKMDFVHDKS